MLFLACVVFLFIFRSTVIRFMILHVLSITPLLVKKRLTFSETESAQTFVRFSEKIDRNQVLSQEILHTPRNTKT
jgi:hypothetical protein